MLIKYIFFIFAGITVSSALMMILSKNTVKCALFMVVAFIASAGSWLLAGAEFLALILILVYVGAVMTLFLFVVMMLNVNTNSFKTNLWKYYIVTMVLISGLCYCMYIAIDGTHLIGRTVLDKEIIDNISAIGMTLYTKFGYSFIISGILLLVAIVASIALVHRSPQHRKTQDVRRQMLTKKDDRLRLLDL
jgi:NADH-quinone oxidoreductase subunit J